MIRKSLLFINVLVIFSFISCTNVINQKETSVTFTLGEGIASQISKAVSTAVKSDSSLTIKCGAADLDQTYQTKNVTLSDLADVTFQLQGIPFNHQFTIFVNIYLGDFLIYQGGSDKLTIKHGDTPSTIITLNPHNSKITYINPDGSTFKVEEYFINSNQKLNPGTKEGYKFEGWYEDKECANIIPKETDFGKNNFAGDIKVYGKWATIKYSITYSGIENFPEEIKTSLPTEYTIEDEINFPQLEKTKYTHDGWFTDMDLLPETKITSIPKGSTGNIEVFADYHPTLYNINFHNCKGGTNTNETTYDFTSVASSELKLDSPTKAGFTFLGWYNNSQLLDKQKQDSIPLNSTGDIDFYAKWQPNITTKIEPKKNEVKITVTKPSEDIIKSIELYEGDLKKADLSTGPWNYTGLTDQDIHNLTLKITYKDTPEVKGSELGMGTSDINFKLSSFDKHETPAVATAYNSSCPPENGNGGPWTYYVFGVFPQTVKENEITIYENQEYKINDLTCYLGSDGYYYVMDSTTNTFSTPKKFSNNEDVIPNNNYYFKVEPIYWRKIADTYQGESGGLLFAEKIIFPGPFYEGSGKRGTKDEYDYLYSTIRAKLNGYDGTIWGNDASGKNAGNYTNSGFIYSAFSDSARGKLLGADVAVADGITNDSTYLTDKAFLLSKDELLTQAYGFQQYEGYTDSGKTKITTDYSALYNNTQYINGNEVGNWCGRTKTPGNKVYTATINGDLEDNWGCNGLFVPAILVNLN